MQVFTASPAAMYTGIGNAFSRISATEGLRTLWRGVSSVILGAGPAHAVHFGTYEFIKEFTGGNDEGSHWISTGEFRYLSLGIFVNDPSPPATAGASATIASDALMNPFDGVLIRQTHHLLADQMNTVIKQRMQIHQSQFRSVFDCARTVYRNEGLSAFYVSYPTTLTMTIPFAACQFAVYEQTKKFLNPNGEYSPVTHVIAGGMAGAVGAAVTTPLDVAKTLLQTRGTSHDPEIRSCRGMLHAFRIIWMRDGLRGFSRGLTPRVLTHMPSNALSWLSYEFFSASALFIAGDILINFIPYRSGNPRPVTNRIEWTHDSSYLTSHLISCLLSLLQYDTAATVRFPLPVLDG